MDDEHVVANYLLIVLDQAGYQWLVSLPENSIDSWEDLREAFMTTSLLPVINRVTSMTYNVFVIEGTNHCATTSDVSRIYTSSTFRPHSGTSCARGLLCLLSDYTQ